MKSRIKLRTTVHVQVFQSHVNELTPEELQLSALEKPLPSDEEETLIILLLITANLAITVKSLDDVIKLFHENDPILECSSQACEFIHYGVLVYWRLYETRRMEQ